MSSSEICTSRDLDVQLEDFLRKFAGNTKLSGAVDSVKCGEALQRGGWRVGQSKV